ncbi:MAG: DMT family transporter [Desulfobulbaceae bacterium]|nr:DMT family transporter [Desulfobulbaceae bacterium]
MARQRERVHSGKIDIMQLQSRLMKFIGIIIGFAGVVIMLDHEALGGLGDNVVAQLAVLGAVISHSFAGIFGRRFAQSGIKPVVTATGQVSASSLLLIPLALFYDKPFTLPMPGPEIWLAILGLALISTAFAYILYFRILSTAGATNLLLVTLLIPLSTILLGTAVLGEQLEVKHMLGMGLISIGVLSIDGRAANILMSKVQIQRACHKRFPNRSRPDFQMLSSKRLILRLKRLLRKSLIS